MRVLIPPGWVIQKSLMKFFDKLKIEETAELQTYPKNLEGNFFFKCESSVEGSSPPPDEFREKL